MSIRAHGNGNNRNGSRHKRNSAPQQLVDEAITRGVLTYGTRQNANTSVFPPIIYAITMTGGKATRQYTDVALVCFRDPG